MSSQIIDLTDVDAGLAHLVGGKAVGLAELLRAGERVPAGFCVTTVAFSAGTIPEREIRQAYERSGGGPVAVRSSATAEDLPDASFAGLQVTTLDVTGMTELIEAVRRCWDSVHTERVVAYRRANQIDDAQMGVVVQRMVDAEVAGVLFTANPVTGCRTEMVIDAAAGPGAALVDGAVAADHYILDGSGRADWNGGCLDPGRLAELHAVGRRLQEHFGCPRDIEWAVDSDGLLWLLQSRPITTLFPVPPEDGRPGPRVYLELGGHFQGVLQPFTPMGVAALKAVAASVTSSFGGGTGPRKRTDISADPGAGRGRGSDPGSGAVVEIAGRVFLDLTDTVRRPGADRWLPKLVEADFGPRVRAVLEQVLTNPCFAPEPRRPTKRGGGIRPLLRIVPRGVAGIVRSLARPAAARTRAFRTVEEFRHRTVAPPGLSTAAERLRFVENVVLPTVGLERMIWPLMAGILAGAVPTRLLNGIASEAEVRTVLGGMPHNVTVEMDLALWRVAERAGEHRELLLDTPPAELAARYRAGLLPDIGLADFLDRYGHRAAVEIDVGVPRWAEDPGPVFAAVANYLRITDPDQTPDRRFARAAAAADMMLVDLMRRARRRPVRGRLAGFLLRRARELGGLREIGKFAGLYPLHEMRKQLLLVGAELADRGLLDRAEDVMFLDLIEANDAVQRQVDYRELVAARRVTYRREQRRTHVPIALLSDGTDVETLLVPEVVDDGTLTGMAAAPGTATGLARVIRDPADAYLEPGEILVAPTTDPGWTPLFLTAGGLVTEIGAPLAHGPTVAREYGIPAVVRVRDATRLIRTGQVITVDGATGTVLLGS